MSVCSGSRRTAVHKKSSISAVLRPFSTPNPSGVLAPSRDDAALRAGLVDDRMLMGIDVQEYSKLVDTNCYSLKETGRI